MISVPGGLALAIEAKQHRGHRVGAGAPLELQETLTIMDEIVQIFAILSGEKVTQGLNL